MRHWTVRRGAPPPEARRRCWASSLVRQRKLSMLPSHAIHDRHGPAPSCCSAALAHPDAAKAPGKRPFGWHGDCGASERELTANRYRILNPFTQGPTVRARRLLLTALLLVSAALPLPAAAQVRIKDIDVEGLRENQLVGYGLVVGLNGTGDKLDNAAFTRESLIGMLERLGVNTRDQAAKLSTKCRGGDGDGGCHGLRCSPHRHRDLRPRRRHQPDRWDAAGDAPARRGRGGLRGDQSRLDRRHRRAGRLRHPSPRGVPTSARSTSRTWSARSPSSWTKAAPCGSAFATPILTTAQRISAAINGKVGAISKATDPRTVSVPGGPAIPIETLTAIEYGLIPTPLPSVIAQGVHGADRHGRQCTASARWPSPKAT